MDQCNTPIADALEKFRESGIVPFDVPGHKRGKGNPELTHLLGERCVEIDVNSMKPLDNICNPVSIIAEAEKLCADAFGAKYAFFIVNGTTMAVQTMVLSVCKAGDKIILPRNVHKCVINALILCGAIPIYINPPIHPIIGVSLDMSVADVERCIQDNPDAVAILVNNPTYYGICSDLSSITAIAHAHGLKVLCDEAHGTHLYFGDNLPVSGMKAGVDMAAVSVHKSGGSLTQSSILLIGDSMDTNYVRKIINLTQTTSASYLLLASLDLSRRNLALKGRGYFSKVVEIAEYARNEINAMGGYYAYGKDLVGEYVYDFDVTKLCIFTKNIGLTGIEVYDLLRDKYKIQVEFGDIGNMMAYLSAGNQMSDIERLLDALKDIKQRYQMEASSIPYVDSVEADVAFSPQFAFYADKESLPIQKTQGRISGEFVMCYPPGIPIIAPGERVTEEIINHILYAQEKGCSLEGAADPHFKQLMVLKNV